MDAQALLTPDAIDHEMGRPLAHVPDQVGDCHASLRPPPRPDVHRHVRGPRHPPGSLLLDERHLPDRRDGPVHPDGARQGRRSCATSTAASPTSSTRTRGIRCRSICPTCGKVGTTIVTDWDGERVFYECRERHVEWATGCGNSGWISPFGGTGKLRLEPRVGRPVVAVRRDHRAERQGPLDRRRLARPGRGDRPRGLRARAAAQHPVRVPEHRRQEDVHVQGPRRGGPPDRRGRAARAAAVPVPAAAARTTPSTSIRTARTQIPRLFDEFDKFAAATAGREVKGEIAPGFDATFRYSLLDPQADVAAEAAAFRVAVRPGRHVRPEPPASTRSLGRPTRRGGAVRAGDGAARRAPRCRDGVARDLRAGLRAVRGRPRPACPRSLAALDEDGRRYLGASADAAEQRATGDRRCLAEPHLRGGDGHRPGRPCRVRGHLHGVPRSAERAASGLAPAGRGSGRSSIERLRAAAA